MSVVGPDGIGDTARMRLLAPAVLAVVASAVACSSSGETASPSPADSAVDAVTGDADGGGEVGGDAETGDPKDSTCTALAQAECKTFEECNRAILEVQYGTIENCRARRKINCLGSAAAPGSGWSLANVEACIKSKATQTCMQSAHGPHAPECTPTGSLEMGAPCGFGIQCKSGNCVVASGACGTCGSPAKALGETCSGFECVSGLFCVASKCTAAAGTGEACAPDKPCWIGATCVAGTCVAKAKKGESCATLPCDGRLAFSCDETSKVCVDFTFAKTGEACGPPSCKGDICRPTSDAGTAGTCVARLPDGAACDASNICQQAAVCSGSKCTPFDATICKGG